MPNLFQRILGIGTKQAKTDNPFIEIMQRNMMELFGLSNKELLKQYRGWVFACVNAIAQDVANIELKLVRRLKDGEEEEVFDHPILDMLNRVNPRMTKYELFEATQSHLELEGNSYWLLARNGVKEVQELWALRPDRVKFEIDKQNPLMVKNYIYVQKGGEKTIIDASDIIHFKNFNSEGDYPFPVKGLSTVEASALAIDTNTFAREWNKNFFVNSARPDLILRTDADLDDDDTERITRSFQSRHQGTKNAHRIALLKGGLGVEKITSSQKDMDFVEQQRFSRDEILAIFRVPKTALGIVEDVNRANAEATNFVFALRTIKPKMQKIIDTLNEFLIPQFKDEGLWLRFESPVPQDREQLVKEREAGIDKWFTRNEIRMELGLPPTRDGDLIFGTLAQVPIDRVEAQKKIEPPAKKEKKKKKGKKGKVEELTTHEFIKNLFDVKPIKKEKIKTKDGAKSQLSHNAVQNFLEIWGKSIESDEKEIEKAVDVYFEGQEKRVIENLKRELKGLKKKEYNLKQASNLLPDMADEIEAAISFMTPEYEKFVKESGDRGLALVGSEVSFNQNNPAVQEFIKERGEFFAKAINETTFAKLEETLDAGLRAGEGIEQLSQRVADVYDKERDFRTVRIARTEASAASNFGNTEGFTQAGVTKHQWVNYGPLDADCIIVNGEVVIIGKRFSNGKVNPPVHPNCVCTTVAVF